MLKINIITIKVTFFSKITTSNCNGPMGNGKKTNLSNKGDFFFNYSKYLVKIKR